METLYKLFYKDQNLFKEEYEKRYNSEKTVHLGIDIGKYEAFYLVNDEIYELLIALNEKNKIVDDIMNKLPKVAFNNYINKSLIDEIRMTNEIESVYSTRKEISSILIDIEKKNKKNRFAGLVNKYYYLSGLNDMDFHLLVSNSADVRKIYNDVFLEEVKFVDSDSVPDGKIFRKCSVSVYSGGEEIHKGIMPEEKIIEYMDTSLNYLNNYKDNNLIKIAVFHYLFGYIHPFYDGNGRINRFISSTYLKQFSRIIPFRLSYTIKENIRQYYEAFKIVNHPNNRGEVTPFILMLLGMIDRSFDNIISSLKEKLIRYDFYIKQIRKTKYFIDKKINNLLEILLSASLFTNLGIYKKDLISVLNISPNTLTNYIEVLEKNVYIINHDGGKSYYLLNLEYFDNNVE